jgi:hypothetical protein
MCVHVCVSFVDELSKQNFSQSLGVCSGDGSGVFGCSEVCPLGGRRTSTLCGKSSPSSWVSRLDEHVISVNSSQIFPLVLFLLIYCSHKFRKRMWQPTSE